MEKNEKTPVLFKVRFTQQFPGGPIKVFTDQTKRLVGPEVLEKWQLRGNCHRSYHDKHGNFVVQWNWTIGHEVPYPKVRAEMARTLAWICGDRETA